MAEPAETINIRSNNGKWELFFVNRKKVLIFRNADSMAAFVRLASTDPQEFNRDLQNGRFFETAFLFSGQELTDAEAAMRSANRNVDIPLSSEIIREWLLAGFSITIGEAVIPIGVAVAGEYAAALAELAKQLAIIVLEMPK